MAARSERVTFPGAQGDALAARLDLPPGPPRATALFAHCFTCSKDVFAAARIADGLTRHGIGVLRFDFTGLGSSEGEFANTTFSSNVGDLVAAADWLRERHGPPEILVGHSLGGAAVVAAADRVPDARAVCTVNAPAEPAHVTHLLTEAREEIDAAGEAEVVLGGRTFRIRRSFLEDIEGHRLDEALASLGKALLVFHSPVDGIVGIDNAARIYAAAKHPKSFVSLGDADHLLTNRADAAYVADVLAAWVARYLASVETAPPPRAPEGAVAVAETGVGRFQQAVAVGGRHLLTADEPIEVGGLDSGPSPYDLLLASLGACTSMTLRLFAERKGLALDRVSVTLEHDRIHASDCATCETESGRLDRLRRTIRLDGDLDDDARARLMEIADRCPVHRTLTSELVIETAASEGPGTP
jgi:putative redox protein